MRSLSTANSASVHTVARSVFLEAKEATEVAASACKSCDLLKAKLMRAAGSKLRQFLYQNPPDVVSSKLRKCLVEKAMRFCGVLQCALRPVGRTY
mmetsp:Transcript_63774/g.126151  ORF Transcript_63774/g.126151 Transcript_63774/m.126151 type:complete len:95 (+) Transcript_63774:629-913(+)